jgi:hypothetical protein
MKYQLVLQFPIDEHFDFDALIDLEDRLLRRIGGEHIVDGHDFGSGEIDIFIHTNDPEGAFRSALPPVSANLLPNLRAAYRELEGEHYRWLHPPKSQEEFTIAQGGAQQVVRRDSDTLRLRPAVS